jgi:hypothetical protein
MEATVHDTHRTLTLPAHARLLVLIEDHLDLDRWLRLSNYVKIALDKLREVLSGTHPTPISKAKPAYTQRPLSQTVPPIGPNTGLQPLFNYPPAKCQ